MIQQNFKKRKRKDGFLNAITYIFASFGLIILVSIIAFVFARGTSTLSWDFITGNYAEKVTNAYLVDSPNLGNYINPQIEGTFFSSKWGVALKDGRTRSKESVVYIEYVDENSPLNNLNEMNSSEYVRLSADEYITKLMMEDIDGNLLIVLGKDGAETMASTFDTGIIITDLVYKIPGEGIRGSLISTFYLIIFSLLFALPLGIAAAIYLYEYAPRSRANRIMSTMIEMSSGIPSIIFGLAGAVIFIPLMNKIINSDGGSIMSGALTMTIILLPVIIKSTEESLKTIPDDYRLGSLALGASKTQTIFKIVIPNAIPGILTATLLSIGRIIGESAALIYAIGASIKDNIALNGRSATLAVHIWTVLKGETPNVEVASAISIIILAVVLILSITIKLISKKLIVKEKVL